MSRIQCTECGSLTLPCKCGAQPYMSTPDTSAKVDVELLTEIVRGAIYNTWHKDGIANVKGVARIAVGAIKSHIEAALQAPRSDTSAVELVRELLDLAKTTRTKIINWQYRDDLVAKANKWLEGVK